MSEWPAAGASRRSWRRIPPATSPLWFLGAAAVASALLAATSTVASRHLGTAALADLRTISGGLGAIGLLAFGLQLAAVRVLAVGATGRVGYAPGLWRVMAAATTGFSVVAGAAAALLIDAPTSFRLTVGGFVAGVTAAGFLAVPSRSVLLAAARWRELGLVILVDAGVRLALAAVLVPGHGLFGSLAAILGGTAASTGLAVALRRPSADRVDWSPTAAHQLRVGTASTLGLVVLLALSSLGSRARFGESAAVIAGSASIARLVFTLPFTIAFLAFPAMARNPVGSPALRRAYHRALLWTAVVAASSCAVVSVAPTQLARLLLGDAGQADPTTVRLLALAAVADAVAVVSLMQYIAHGSRLATTTWLGAAVMASGQLLARTPEALGAFALGGGAVLLAAVSVPALLRVQPVLHPVVPEEPDRPHQPSTQGVTVVVPCYNPGPAVERTLRQIRSVMDAAGLTGSIVAVSDGSTDGSDLLIDALDVPDLEHHRLERNRGKGAALRHGFAVARTPIVGFVDADGDLAPAQLVHLLRMLEDNHADIAFGSKRHAESTVDASALRRSYSRGFQSLVRLLFQLDIPDTQTGIKLYRRALINDVLPLLREEGFALDLEIFVAARQSGYTRFVEVPVSLVRQDGSTIGARSVVVIFLSTLRIFWRAKISLVYLRAVGGRTEAGFPR